MSNIIDRLVEIIKNKRGSDVKSSYTSFLLSKGNNYCLNKFKEEVNELEKAITDNKNTIHESADVIYHLLVTLELSLIHISEHKRPERIGE